GAVSPCRTVPADPRHRRSADHVLSADDDRRHAAARQVGSHGGAGRNDSQAERGNDRKHPRGRAAMAVSWGRRITGPGPTEDVRTMTTTRIAREHAFRIAL